MDDGVYTGRGGYRPGAGRPRTVIKAQCRAEDVASVERWAGQLGVTPEQLAGVLIKHALRDEKLCIIPRDFR